MKQSSSLTCQHQWNICTYLYAPRCCVILYCMWNMYFAICALEQIYSFFVCSSLHLFARQRLSDRGWDEGEGCGDSVPAFARQCVTSGMSKCDQRSKVIYHQDNKMLLCSFPPVWMSVWLALCRSIVGWLSKLMSFWLEWEDVGSKVCMAAGSISVEDSWQLKISVGVSIKLKI